MGAAGVVGLVLLASLIATSAHAQYRKIGEMELRLSGLSATVENPEPVVPKHTPGGIRILVRAAGVDLSLADVVRFLGPTVVAEGDLSGPGFSQPLSLPLVEANGEPSVDPLVLRTPPIPIAGAYRLSNLRLTVGGRTVLDVEPSSVPLRVIDQILVTQVQTRALTLDEIKAKGIVLDSDDYLGFEFTMGFKIDSKAIDIKFPVVFDRQGVAVPQPLSPPPAPMREGIQLPTIVPLLLGAEDEAGQPVDIKIPQPNGPPRQVNIPAVLVIPGNVGYLKQFFSAQLYVSNGAPVGSGLNVRDVRAKLLLPAGADGDPGTLDDPLALPEIERDGQVITQPLTMDVRGLGADGVPATDDDEPEMAPSKQGQAEFLIRGEQEGFHQIQFDLTAQLLGLPIGPVTVKGKAMGGVLVRNPYFNVTFTVPSVVRTGERFKMRATVTNIGKGIGNDVSMTLDSSRMSGLILEGDATKSISTLKPGDAKVLEFEFVSQRNGKVVATYLKFDTQSGASGQLNFTIGVGERNVPLSPDTLVLPASTAALPTSVVDAAMRVLGQAWSIANAPAGTLPASVIRVNGQVVLKKALALAEAGLRVTLGQASDDAVRDLLVDFYGGDPVDPGFDQLLRTTEAGHAFVQAVGAALTDAVASGGGAREYEYATARVMASSGSFLSFAWDGPRADIAAIDGAGRTTLRSTDYGAPRVEGANNVLGAVMLPVGSNALLSILTQPTAGPYRFDVRASGSGTGEFSVSFERPDGSFARATRITSVVEGMIMRVNVDPGGSVTLQKDEQGDGVFEDTTTLAVDALPQDGPKLLAAAIIGPETLDGAGPWGFQTALVFDRVVSEESAARVLNYSIPNNSVRAAKRQLSGRLVFASLVLPEGPYVPTQVSVAGIRDNRGVAGPSLTESFSSRLEDIGAVVSGRVLGSEGETLPERTVFYSQNLDLSCAGARIEGMARAVTDQSGTFELRYVRQDQCGVRFLLHTVDPTSGARRSQSLAVRSPGEEIVADFVMLAAGSVTGVVNDLFGQGVPGAKVTVLSQTEPQVGASTMTDALGHYVVSGITVGPVVVRAGKGNGVGASSGRVDRPNVPAVIDVTIDGGSVTARGVVRKVEDNVASPAAGAVVTYWLVVGNSQQVMAAGLTDTQGKYSFSGLPLGDFRIKAEVNTRDSASVTGSALADQEVVRDIAVTIPPVTSLGRIEGLVVMPNGLPAPGMIVSSGGASVLSSPAGTFSIPVVPRLTSHIVNATTRDRKRSGQTAVQVVTSGQVVTGALITLSGLGAAEFTVVDTGGQPLPGRTVRLLSGADPCGSTSGTTDSMGRARFPDLPLGSVAGQIVNSGEIVDVARASVSIAGDGQTGFGILRVETRASSISGTVQTSLGQAVFGAEVELVSPMFVQEFQFCGMKNVVTHRARTGLDGRFSFSGVHPGRVYVSATQAFFPTRVSTHYDLQPGQAGSVTLTLVDTISGEISGNVFEPDGITSAGGGVEVTLNGPLPDVTVFTNALGRFAFAKILPAGSYRLTARDPITGLVERSTIYVAPLVDAVHDIRLKGKAKVRVSVTDALAEPVSQAYVTLREAAFPSRVFEGVVAPSNQGVIEFPGVFEGAVSIEVRDSFGRGGRSSLTIPTGVATVDAVVRISTTGTVRGRFLMPDGSPIPYGGMKLLVANRLIGQVTASPDNPPGGFEFTYVPAGSFRIEGLDPLTARTGLAVGVIEAEGQEVEIDVRAQSIGSVSGLVTSNGVPLAGVRVDLVSGGYSAATTTDAAGSYLVQGVPEGRVTVSAYTGTGFLRANNSGTLSGEGGSLTLDVALRGTGTLSGQVFKAGGLVSAGVVGVSLYAGGLGGGSITGSTDEDGTFSFDRVPAGLVQIDIDALGSEDFATGTFEVVAGEDTTANLQLNGIGDLRGLGLDSQREPTAGRMIIQLGPPLRSRSYVIDLGSNGRFELPKVLAGPFTAQLVVTESGLTRYGTASGQITDGVVTEIEVELQASGIVTGVVLRSDGVTPAYGANVTLQTATGAKTSRQAQPDGSFEFRGVVIGNVTVNVADPVTAGVARATAAIAVNGDVVNLGTLTLDDAAVAVVSTTPADGAVGISVNQPVQVTFSDALVNTMGVRVANGAATVGAVTTLSPDGRVVTLTPASAWPDSRELTIEARTTVTDIFGRHPAQTFTSRFITQDLSPPAVAAIAPASLSIQNEPSATVTVTFSEPLAGTTDLQNLVRLSQGAVVLSGTTTLNTPNQAVFVPAAPLPINANLSVLVNGARDPSGNTQTTAFNSTFKTLDTIAPTLSLNAPLSGSWTTDSTPTISIGLADGLSGVEASTGTLILDDVAANPTRTAAVMALTPNVALTDGMHALSATVQDKAGNLGILSASFGVDATPPQLAEITSGVSPGAVVSGTISLSAAGYDATSGLARIQILEGATVRATLLPPTFTVAYNTNGLAEGAHTFAARAEDIAGNVAEVGPAIPFFVDNNVLTLGVTAPSSGLRIRDSVTASATTSEPVSRVVFAVGSSVFEDLAAPYTATLDTSSLPEGNHTVTITAYALTGEPTLSTVAVFVDRTPPFDPDMSRITADDQGNGLAQVVGLSAAIVGGTTAEVRKTGTVGPVGQATIATDGSFATRVAAAEGDFVEVRALDSVGNASQWLPLLVARTVNAEGLPQRGLAMWVKADAGVSTDASGLVSSWADQSTRANNLQQSNAVRRPAIVPNGVNAYPLIRFDGTSDSLSFTTRMASSIRAVFMVIREDASASGTERTTLGDSVTTQDFRGSLGALFGNGQPRVTNGSTFINGLPVAGATVARPKSLSVVSVVPTEGATANTFGSLNGGGGYWWGDLAELIIYDEPLSDSERVQVERYLAQKYIPNEAVVGTPRVSPPGSVFNESTTVTLAGQPGATIYYTLDGSDPVETPEQLYTESFVISATTTVKARAFKLGLNPSTIATATFIEGAGAPIRRDSMALWVRADAGLATDVTFSSVWADQSSRGNHLLQTEGLRLPRLALDDASGLPVMQFDGTSDFMRFTNRISSSVRTVFMVVKEDTSASGTERTTLGDSVTTQDFRGSLGALFGNGQPRVTNGSTFINGLAVPSATVARPKSLSVISVLPTEGATANMFGSLNGAGGYWWGDLAELIVYDQVLSSADRAQVEGYLLAKYGIGGRVVTPVVSPGGGLFTNEVSVSISTPTPGATIRYTLDGTDPTATTGDVYTASFTVSATTTVKARAFKDLLADSDVASAGFTKDTDSNPKSVAIGHLALWWRADAGVPSGLGDYWADQSGNLNHGIQAASSSTARLIPNAANGLPAMRFDGTSDFMRFTNRMLSSVRTVFMVVKEDTSASGTERTTLGDSVTTQDFRGSLGALFGNGQPRVTNGSTFINGLAVPSATVARPKSLSVISVLPTEGATANMFGSLNGAGGYWWGDLAELIVYDQVLSSADRAQVEGYLLAKYGIGGRVVTPVVSPGGGLFTNEVSVSISTPTPGATIRYTLDGTDPTATTGDVYTASFTVSATTTVKARAFKDLLADSDVASAGFTKDTDSNPKSVAIGHLALWWRADAGVPSGLGDYWADQSGNLNHGIQAASSSTARLIPNAANGLPAMRFDGTSDFMRFTNRMLSSVRTVFMVVKEDTSASGTERTTLGDSVTTQDFRGSLGALFGNGQPRVTNGSTFINGLAVPSATVARPKSLSVISVVPTEGATANMFGSLNGTGGYWWGDLAELIIYDRALNAPERQQIETYLKGKYAIP